MASPELKPKNLRAPQTFLRIKPPPTGLMDIVLSLKKPHANPFNVLLNLLLQTVRDSSLSADRNVKNKWETNVFWLCLLCIQSSVVRYAPACGGTCQSSLLCDQIHWSSPYVLVIQQIYFYEDFGTFGEMGNETWSDSWIWPAESKFLTLSYGILFW